MVVYAIEDRGNCQCRVGVTARSVWSGRGLQGAFLLLLTFLMSIGHAAVVTTAADDGSGSLRQAIENQSDGEIITFAASLAGSTITLSSTIEIDLKNPGSDEAVDLTIDGDVDGDGTADITISGNEAVRLFTVLQKPSRSEVAFRNLILKDGRALGAGPDGQGAAIWCGSFMTLILEGCQFINHENLRRGGAVTVAYASWLTVDDCSFTDCHSIGPGGQGGGLAGWSINDISVRNSRFSNCSAEIGGALAVTNSVLSLEGCVFEDNRAFPLGGSGSVGGAVYTDGASDNKDNAGNHIHIEECVFRGNESAGEAGALYLFLYVHDTAIIEHCLFEDNSATRGGAVRFGNQWYQSDGVVWPGPDYQPFTVDGCTFSANTATDGGACAMNSQSKADFTNCTFNGNAATRDGGVFHVYIGEFCDLIFDYCTFADNNSEGTSSLFFIGNIGGDFIIDHSIIAGNSEENGGLNALTTVTAASSSDNILWPLPGSSRVPVTPAVTIDPDLGILQDNGHPVATRYPGASDAVHLGAFAALLPRQRQVTIHISPSVLTEAVEAALESELEFETGPIIDSIPGGWLLQNLHPDSQSRIIFGPLGSG